MSITECNVHIAKWNSRNIELKIIAPFPCKITLRQYFFPTWEATINGRAVVIKPSIPDGLIDIDIQKGHNHVRVQIIKSFQERIGFMLSIISALCTIFFNFYFRKHI